MTIIPSKGLVTTFFSFNFYFYTVGFYWSKDFCYIDCQIFAWLNVWRINCFICFEKVAINTLKKKVTILWSLSFDLDYNCQDNLKIKIIFLNKPLDSTFNILKTKRAEVNQSSLILKFSAFSIFGKKIWGFI